MRAFFFCLYSPVSSENRPGIPQIAATPTSVFTLVGVAAVCGIPGLFTDETGE